jgi:hypothetical protein
MKKGSIFILILVIAGILACTMPTSIEIKGSPSLNIPVVLDFSSLFSGFLDEGITGGDNMVIKECTNPSLTTMTYIIRVPIFEYSIPLDAALTIGVPLGSDFVLLDTNDASKPGTTLPLDFGGLGSGSFIDGFKFNSANAKLYVSGSNATLMNALTITMTQNSTSVTLPTDKISSGFNTWGTTYTGTGLPDGGASFNINNLLDDHSSTSFGFKVYFPSGTTVNSAMLNNADITAELVIWLPMSLTVTAPTGADFTLMDMSDSDDDLFGRTEAGSGDGTDNFIKSLDLTINLTTNPFSNGTMHIKSGTVDIPIAMGGNSFHLIISEDNMQLINDPLNFPFAPVISVSYPSGGTLSIPRTLKTTRLNFTAEISYIIDLRSEL